MLPPHVPAALAAQPNWIYWQSEFTTEGVLTKTPYQVNAWKTKAAPTRSQEWVSLPEAFYNYNESNRSGLGYVFKDADNIFGIDVDDIEKIAPENQDASMRLRAMIVEHFPTYAEISPSGTGYHLIGFGTLPTGVKSIKDSKYGIEVYDCERFFTFTGNVTKWAKAIELVDCQEALEDLAHTLRGSSQAVQASVVNGIDPRTVAQVIADTTGWANGAEFTRLMNDPISTTLSRYKNDHSGADLALCNYIATATTEVDKAVEIFRQSPLWRDGGKGGYKPEQKYIDDYLIGFNFNKVWKENVIKETQNKLAIEEGAQIAKAITAAALEPEGFDKMYNVVLPGLDMSDKTCPLPPGMAGRIVQAVYDACATPVPEFAVSVTMAFLSGLIGRAYRYKGQGTNAFFIVAAKSATGKTQAIGALQRLLGQLSNPLIADRLYAVSGKTVQGLHPFFEKSPAGGWITDECGAQIKALVEPNGQHDYELKDAINSLFDAAVPGKKWSPPASRTSQKEDKTITSLSVGIAWFTTKDKMYTALNDTEIADGFLSRFIPVFYNGTMGNDNFDIRDEFPTDVAKMLELVWTTVAENDVHMPINGVANSSKTVKITATVGAERIMREFSVEARNVTRRAQDDNDDLPETFIAMSRVGITAQRLAGVCAVLDNPMHPVIQAEHVTWAIQLVGSRMMHVLELMSTGEVGSGDRVEVSTIIRVMKRLVKQHSGEVPLAVLHDRLRLLSPFKEARMGPMNMVKQALVNLVEEGRINKVILADGYQGRPRTVYTATRDVIWR